MTNISYTCMNMIRVINTYMIIQFITKVLFHLLSVCMFMYVSWGHMNTMIDVWSQRTALDIGPILGFYCYDTTA